MKTNILKNINTCTIIALITALAVVNQAVTLQTFDLGNLYYAILIFTLFITFFQSTIRKLDIGMTIIYIACILSILLNDISAVYRPWERFILFVIVTFTASPFIQSDFYDKFRVNTFKYIQNLWIIVVILSIPALLFREQGRTGFEGFTSHSMIMSSTAAMAIVTLLYKLYAKKLTKIIAIPLIIVAFLCMLLAGSRIALTACIGGTIFFLFRVYRKRMDIFIRIAATIIVAIVITFPLWDSYLEKIEQKNSAINQQTGEVDILSSRTLIWDQRIREFKESPLVGIGFGYAPYITAYNERTGKASFLKTETGVVEPGSGWLAIMSMTGLLGLLGFILLWGSSFKKCIQCEKKDKLWGSYLFAMLIFVSIQMIAEGGIYAAGGIDCFRVWILIGAIHGSHSILKKYNT